ncbi:hypothetical protein CIC12_28930 [Burkholderia sp. SG-MS1]|uniref:helix-turn-helix domain-containing protein n=1 Tax=Paraburkholderia sp. SG-MS1 TaxID=2023741 RepID=UPI001446959E|nr:hypothetical protein [Paraburkholderia sp. SG-MS1]
MSVAEQLGISRRCLSAIFAGQGESVERFSWGRRLDKCARDLSDPGQPARAIGDIAFSWGFRSLPHFSQTFKAKLGKTPREFRKTRSEARSHRRAAVGHL